MIATFYSFKGGVGRTFSLLEAAAQLAGRGASVLVWDLDLEAPGMQKNPSLSDLDARIETGTLDLVHLFRDRGYEFPQEEMKEAILSYPLSEPLAEGGGRLDFLLPGKLDDTYVKKFSDARWEEFFAPKHGPGQAFFYDMAMRLLGLGYEYLLIDARTGFTNLNAVCNFYLPDLVVLVFNLNEQNLAGTARVHKAVTTTPARQSSSRFIPAALVANMVPDVRPELRQAKLDRLAEQGIRPHVELPLLGDLLLTEEVPSFIGDLERGVIWKPLVDRLEARSRELGRDEEIDQYEKNERGEGCDLELIDGAWRTRKRFEDDVAELFRLLGYRAELESEQDGVRFDLRLERKVGLFTHVLVVGCRDTARPVSLKEVRAFLEHIARARQAGIAFNEAALVTRSGFTNNAFSVAEERGVRLLTYEQLLLSLVDLEPHLDAAVSTFQGTALERLYVEQDVVLQSEIRPGERVMARGLTKAVHEWLAKPSGTLFTLLGDFGSGKTSFCQRLASELATEVGENPKARRPVMIDLREGGSTTVTLENLLTHRCQRLASKQSMAQPVNPQALLRLNREGYLVLIFDGFDETIGYSEPSRFIENLRQILRAAKGKAKLILTCRTHYFRDQPEEVRRLGEAPEVLKASGTTPLYEEIRERPGSEVGYLREFDEDQINTYLKKALPPPDDWWAFRDEIRRTYNLEDLAERPFLLEMIVKTLPRLRESRRGEPGCGSGGAEVTIARLYEEYCASWFQKGDFRLRLTSKHREALVEHLARLLWNMPGQKVHYEVLADKAVEFFRDQPLSPFDKEQIDYEVRTALFLRRDAAGYYNFIHRSFLEFFVARTLRTGLEGGDRACLDLRPLTREVVFFLEQWTEAEKIPELTGKVFQGAYTPRISENALRLLYFHVRSKVAGPLAGPDADKVDSEELLAGIAVLFGELRSDVVNLEGADFSAEMLRGADLSGARLAEAKLDGVDLRGAVLDGARLEGASLAFADLRGARLEGATLTGAVLDHVDARHAVLRSAVLDRADLTFGRFAGVDFAEASMGEAQVLERALGAGFLGAFGIEGSQAELRCVPQVGHGFYVRCVAWRPDGRVVASGGDDGTIRVWDPVSGRVLAVFEGHRGEIFSVAWAQDGHRIVSGSEDKTVKIWDSQSGAVEETLEGHTRSVLSVAWAQNGQRIASGSEDKTIKIWDLQSGTVEKTLEGHTRSVLSVVWAQDGHRIASGSSDKTVKIWNSQSGAVEKTLEGHTRSVLSVAWAQDSQRIASGSKDKAVRIWDSQSGAVETLAGHAQSVWSVAWDQNGQRVASGSYDNTVKIWDSQSGVVTLEGHTQSALSVAWAQDGHRIASSSSDETVRIWDSRSGAIEKTLKGHTQSTWSVAWAQDGQRIASGSSDKTVKIWDSQSGAVEKTLEGHMQIVWSVAWAQDGHRIASGSSDKTIKIWDSRSGAVEKTLEGHTRSVLSVAWAQDGHHIASGSSDNMVKIWDSRSGAVKKTLEGHTRSVLSVAWARDGRRIASGSDDNTVKIWDSKSGAIEKTLEGHTLRVWSVVWAQDGRRLASGSYDHTVKIWDVKSGSLLWTLEVAWGARGLAWHDTGRLTVATYTGFVEIWDVEGEPRRLAQLYEVSPVTGLVVTEDGYVDGPPSALDNVRFADGWALYDLEDVPERHSPERVRAALAGSIPS